MSKQNRFSISKRLKSFVFAFQGLKILFAEEHNFRVHFFAALFAILVGILLEISPFEWIAILMGIGMVMALEAMNSAIENLADFVSPGQNEKIAKIKDIAAAAVFIAALIALMIGIIVFLPKIIILF